MRPALAGLPRTYPVSRLAEGPAASYKLSSNENPYPPLPGVLAATSEGVRPDEPLSRHGQCGDHRGRGRPARMLTEGQLAFGAGSVAVLYALLLAVCEPGDDVVFAWRSFEAYPDRGPAHRGEASVRCRWRPARFMILLRCGRQSPPGDQGDLALHTEQPDRSRVGA